MGLPEMALRSYWTRTRRKLSRPPPPPFTDEEDAKILAKGIEYAGDWSKVVKTLGTVRTQKSVSDRYRELLGLPKPSHKAEPKGPPPPRPPLPPPEPDPFDGPVTWSPKELPD
jgi:hypothetical protein